MAEFVKVETHPEAEILCQEELNVLLSAVEIGLGSAVASMAGTFILDGQRDGQEAACLLRFDLPEGSYTELTSYTADNLQWSNTVVTSTHLTEASINAVLAWPKGQIFRSLAEMREKVERIPSGIYDEGEYLVMVLNATGGRFLMSLKARFPNNYGEYDGYARMTMHLMARTLGRMRPSDVVLQESAKLLEEKECDLEYFGASLDELCFLEWVCIDHEFRECKELAFKAWKDWREQASEHNEMTMYFQ